MKQYFLFFLIIINTLSVTAQTTGNQFIYGRLSLSPSGTNPDLGYNGNLVITKPAASGQYINLVRQGMYPWSIGTAYNTSNFGIGYGKANDVDFIKPFFLITPEGKIGIGTTNPDVKLEVVTAATENGNDIVANFIRASANTGGSSILRLTGNTSSADIEVNSGYSNTGTRYGSYFDLNIVNNNNYLSDSYGGINMVTNGLVRMNVAPTGNVGIGTTTPQAGLHVTTTKNIGGNSISAILGNSYNDWTCFGGSTGGRIRGSEEGYIVVDPNPNGYGDKNLYLNYSCSSDILMANGGGNVGIGTTSPDARLTVNGTIHAREVKVDLTGALADFVFNTDYQLMPLTEVEQFVKTNKHLPSVPSANEVKENGLNMGEMQNKLLQKIEELTLYLIEQQKINQSLSRRVEELEAKAK